MNTIALNKTMRHAELDSASPAKREGIAGQARNDGRISLNRLKYLFREYFVTHWKRDLLIFGSVFLAKVLFTRLSWQFPDTAVVLVVSIILCGTFNFLYKGSQGMNYLLCPANTEEKLVVNMLLVHIYCTVMLVFACLLGLFIGKLINPCTSLILNTKELLNYSFFEGLLVWQSIFIFTSIYFKKNSILKTALIIFFIFIIVVIFFIANMINIVGLSNTMILQSPDFSNYLVDIIRKHVWILNLLNWIMIVFFWVLSYFRLRETEV